MSFSSTIKAEVPTPRAPRLPVFPGHTECPHWLEPFAPNPHIAKWDDIGIDAAVLYDIEHDIGETRDVAADNMGTVESLLALSHDVREEFGDYDRIGSGA